MFSVKIEEFNKYDSIQIDIPEEVINEVSFNSISLRGFFSNKAEEYVCVFVFFNKNSLEHCSIAWNSNTYLMRPCRMTLTEKTIKNF